MLINGLRIDGFNRHGVLEVVWRQRLAIKELGVIRLKFLRVASVLLARPSTDTGLEYRWSF